MIIIIMYIYHGFINALIHLQFCNLFLTGLESEVCSLKDKIENRNQPDRYIFSSATCFWLEQNKKFALPKLNREEKPDSQTDRYTLQFCNLFLTAADSKMCSRKAKQREERQKERKKKLDRQIHPYILQSVFDSSWSKSVLSQSWTQNWKQTDRSRYTLSSTTCFWPLKASSDPRCDSVSCVHKLQFMGTVVPAVLTSGVNTTKCLTLLPDRRAANIIFPVTDN